jgi:hypothetical protein
MNAADFNDDPGATGEAEPTCELCGASIGIFLGGPGMPRQIKPMISNGR